MKKVQWKQKSYYCKRRTEFCKSCESKDDLDFRNNKRSDYNVNFVRYFVKIVKSAISKTLYDLSKLCGSPWRHTSNDRPDQNTETSIVHFDFCLVDYVKEQIWHQNQGSISRTLFQPDLVCAISLKTKSLETSV